MQELKQNFKPQIISVDSFYSSDIHFSVLFYFFFPPNLLFYSFSPNLLFYFLFFL